MQKRILFKIILFSLAVLFLNSCTISTETQDDRISLVENRLKKVLGGEYVWLHEDKIDKDIYIEHFYSTLDGGIEVDGKIEFFNRTINSAEMTISTDYLCKLFAPREKIEYSNAMEDCFDEFTIIVKTKDRFVPINEVIYIDEDGSEKVSEYTFYRYLYSLIGREDSLRAANNPIDIYIVVRSQDDIDVNRMEAVFMNFKHHFALVNGKFCFADNTFTQDFNSITEDSFTENYYKLFKKVYTFRYDGEFYYQ